MDLILDAHTTEYIRQAYYMFNAFKQVYIVMIIRCCNVQKYMAFWL